MAASFDFHRRHFAAFLQHKIYLIITLTPVINIKPAVYGLVNEISAYRGFSLACPRIRHPFSIL